MAHQNQHRYRYSQRVLLHPGSSTLERVPCYQVDIQTCVRTTDSSGPAHQIQRHGRPSSRHVGQLRRRTDLSIPTTQRVWSDLSSGPPSDYSSFVNIVMNVTCKSCLFCTYFVVIVMNMMKMK